MNSVASFRDIFDRVVVIHLARRPERLEWFDRAMGTWPFRKPQMFEAIDGLKVNVPLKWKKGPGAWGCMLSHRAVVEAAIEEKVSSLLVLEDDACPVADFSARAFDFLMRVPGDWDGLMLGAQHLVPPVLVRPGIVQCMGANRTHAYVLHGRMMPVVLELWNHYDTEHCDIVLASAMRYFKVYAPDPFLIGQDAGHSDITERNEPMRFLTAGQIERLAVPDESTWPRCHRLAA